ncbi:MAG TPA: peroxiredoxin [Afifellaceae bacterium]|nr:peroxiredoxin [Afifellaceae bacterium]
MKLTIGDTAPDFQADTTQGPIRFHEWIGDSWCLFFSHPKDFTPVCTTELGSVAQLEPEFARRNVKIIGLSVEVTGHRPGYPLIGDPGLEIAKLYGMLDNGAAGKACTRTAADNATVRSVFVIGPDKKIKTHLTYPMSTGRNFSELLRVIESLQLTADHQVATPAGWQPGEDVIILPAISNEEAQKRYPQGWEEPKPYLRIVPHPQ